VISPLKVDDRDHRPVWIRDDQWATVAFGFLLVGAMIGALGFLPEVEKGVGVAGLVIFLAGAWILARPVGLVIEKPRLSVTIRSFISERRLSYADLSGVEVRPALAGYAMAGLLGTVASRYDVVLRLRDRDEVIVRRELTLPAAKAEAQRLEYLIKP